MEAGRRALDFSIRAVDAYRKTLLIDKVTSGDDQSPPVYILNEISDTLRSCSVDLVQEIVEYAFKRLRHHSPQVKYKVLRFITYTVNRAGSAAYRKLLQSHSASIRELFNFQGQVDPFKGNAPNQAVRDAAHEAIKAIFSSDVGGLPTSKSINDRIEGFGNGNFSKSFISSYRSSTTVDEMDTGSLQYYEGSACFDSVTCKQDYKSNVQENAVNKPNRESQKVSSPEEDLLDKVTASQGLRLQPTHERLQLFLTRAKTLDAIKMTLALKAKLQSPSWQVQFKALCVLQALLPEKDRDLLQAIEADRGGFLDCVQACLHSPQATVQKKAKEVFESLQALMIPSQSDEGDTSSMSPPATSCQVVDLMSFSNDDITPFQETKTSPNSVMDDPFDGMSIHGTGGASDIHGEDLLASGWTDNNALGDLLSGGCTDNIEYRKESAVGNLQIEPFGILRSASQPIAMTQHEHKIHAVDNAAHFTFKNSTSSGKSVLSLNSKPFRTKSDGNVLDLQNLNALYMLPMGMLGPSRNIGALQQCPGGIQGFDFGIHNANASINGQTAAGRHALGEVYFKEFGFSN